MPTPHQAGETIEVDGKKITVAQETPAGHKVLISDTRQGDDIIKYGYPIGHAAMDLKAGQWVNENNLKTNLAGTLSYSYNPIDTTLSKPTGNATPLTFKGYRRANGEVGVRNELWIVPTVGCVNGTAERLAAMFPRKLNWWESMPYTLGTTTTDAPNWVSTMRIRARYCATSACTPTQEAYWCCRWDAKTTSPTPSWRCWATTITTASSCW